MRKQLAWGVYAPSTNPLPEGEFIPSEYCNKSFRPHRRVEVVVKVKSDGITTKLAGTCKVCHKIRAYTETLKADFNTPIVGANYLRSTIK